MKSSRVDKIAVHDIRPNEWNCKSPMSEADRVALRAGIKKLGFAQAVTVFEHVDGGYVIVDGEDRWRAAHDCGEGDIPVLILECYTMAELKALTIQLNQVRGDNDPMKRRELMASISPDLDMDRGELAELMALPAPDWEPDDATEVLLEAAGPDDFEPAPRLRKFVLHLTAEAEADLLHEMELLSEGFDLINDRVLEIVKRIRKEIGWNDDVMMEIGLRVLAELGPRSP